MKKSLSAEGERVHMQLTAAVIHAGLGDLSIGLEMAGFHVIAAFDPDKKALEIHSRNLNTQIFPLSLEQIEVESFPCVDLLAAHIYQTYSRAGISCAEEREPELHKITRILAHSRPRAFFFLANTALTRSVYFRCFLEETAQYAYKIIWKNIDVSQLTGFPVNEGMVCIIGVGKDTDEFFQFPEPSAEARIPWDVFLQRDAAVDPWYYQVDQDRCLQFGEGQPLLCWKGQGYFPADVILWNYVKIPLVKGEGGYRKITHREIATLKGFPEGYDLSEKSRQWLYKKLMYSGNIIVIKQIAGMLNYALTSNPWRNQQKRLEETLTKLFRTYLERRQPGKKNGADWIEKEFKKGDTNVDFALYREDERYYFEIKYYSSHFSLNSKIKTACQHLAKQGLDGRSILTVTNIVPEVLKEQCFSAYGIEIWDIKNLLWLFDGHDDLKNELVALLNFSVDGIEPAAPNTILFASSRQEPEKEKSLAERLLQIPPGTDHFSEYESVCVDILKYVLGQNLTLWRVQERSNDGLYRFDLCCKIKNDVNHDFFDTIKNYFNTKYIVFEFKNHSKKITQKEIYTTEKYLYEKALRKVAVVVSRAGADEHALQAARGCLRETGKLILCLSDNSLLQMIEIKENGEQAPADFLEEMLDNILLYLEK